MPRPLVPPVTMCAPPKPAARAVMRMTILPIFVPLCSVRKARAYCASMSKLLSGRLVVSPASARRA
eukprot:2550700-Prymnesium_polylepis.1